MKKRKISLYIEDILNSIAAIESYLVGITQEQFEDNKMVTDAVIRNFEIIGEAAKYISEEIRFKFPNIPWGNMVALRNIVIHNYLGVDLDIIYEIATKDFPSVKNELQSCFDLLINLENQSN
ncbi:MAG: DUF86 domain-containing protein [Candidatus Margulisiibacteriota bacterium]|jgi:uncharacterized protein with HEPN domain